MPGKTRDEGARLDAADLLMQLDRHDEAGQILGGEYVKEADRAQALRSRLALAAGGADTAALEARLAADENDHAARLELSPGPTRCRPLPGPSKRPWKSSAATASSPEGAGRQAMLQLFQASARRVTMTRSGNSAAPCRRPSIDPHRPPASLLQAGRRPGQGFLDRLAAPWRSGLERHPPSRLTSRVARLLPVMRQRTASTAAGPSSVKST